MEGDLLYSESRIYMLISSKSVVSGSWGWGTPEGAEQTKGTAAMSRPGWLLGPHCLRGSRGSRGLQGVFLTCG